MSTRRPAPPPPPQVDVLLATCTVKETLQFHAALRLPHHWTQGQRAAAVDRVLTQLGLTSCADTRVGDETAGMKGVSGGERRRLAIGVELIRNPSIIFLDEPTTGLDSATALQVVSCIAKVAQQHPAAVIMSVHQPGPEVCALFDDLVLLAAGGRCCFMGPWKQAVPWFKNVLGRGPGVMQAEAEWFLSLLTDSCSPASGDESPGTPNSSSGRKNNSSSKRSAGGAMEDGTLASTSTSSTSSQGVDLLVDRWSTKAVKAPGGAPSAEAAQDLQQQQQQQQLARPTIIVVAPGYDAASDRSGDSPSSTVSSQGQLPTFSRGGKGASGRGEAGGGGGLVRALSRSLSSAAPGGGSSTTQHKQLVSSRSAALTAAAAAAAGGAWGEEAGRRPNWLAVSAREVAVLSGRSLRWWGRNPAMLVSEILQYGFACVFLGSLYPQLAPVVPAGVPDRLTALFTFVVTLMVTAPSRALLAWDVERKLLR
jgi:ABC-type multidrug transport system ATPase subunit